MPITLSRPRITAALIAAAFVCSAGLASAGSLPGATQDIASDMLAKVGITVPGPNDSAGTRPNGRGNSADAPVTLTNAGKGGGISDLATATEAQGVEKGAAISTVASDGKSQAGSRGVSAAAEAPVQTPNEGGTSTANTASGGASLDGAAGGTDTADTASGGRSAAGSGNAESAPGVDHP
jgi:hypothetical protein